MLFSDIKGILTDAKIIGKLNKKKIKNISSHSINANPNCLLVVDKHKKFKKIYLQEAILKGLNTIITNKYFRNLSITQILVKNIDQDTLKLLKLRQPFAPEKSVAITGTNGKTSTSWFLAQICLKSDKQTKLTGTLGYFENLEKVKDSHLTTPNYLDLYQFAYSSKKNSNLFISEASSHGLDQGRFNNINIDVAAITNISHDHLDYHKNFKAYKKSKFLLFTKILKKKGIAIINSRLKDYDDLISKIKSSKIKVITFGSKDVYFEEKNYFNLVIFGKKHRIKNLYLNNIQKQNLECAIACALALNINLKKILKSLYKLQSVSGRFEEIFYKKKSSKIVIDYAHTPDAIKNILQTYKYSNLKPSIVFGCGGDRDKSKRKEMGLIAQKYANRVYITDDNPRNENPEIIRKKIKKYCPKSIEISDRRKAIETAILQINRNEVLIIAGKGHEKYQIIKNRKIKFDDYQVVKNFIR